MPTSRHDALPPAARFAAALNDAGTDKHRIHGYAPMYASLTSSRDIRSIFEIGVLRGESIRAWRRLFPQAEIVAADADPAAASHVADIPGVRFVLLDVSDAGALSQFAREHRDRFDLVIDDSTHKAAHQVAVKRHLLGCVRPGGVMVIEDVPNDAAAAAIGGKVWDFRAAGRWDSRAVSIDRPVRPRVLLCGQYLERDGAPIILANLARNLTAWDVAVHSPLDGPMRAELEAAGIEVAIGDTLDLAGVDLVVANTLAAAYAVRAARAAGVPCVWLIHESDPAMCGNLDEVHKLIDYPKEVVFPCQSTADVYEPIRMDYRIVPSIIPPVPPRTEEPAFRRFHIVTFGRDEPRKGQADIRAAVEGDPTIRYSAVHDADNPHEWLQVADLYVCSSRVEAFPLSLQEAKAYGLPVITTPVFGCSEIIRDGIDGLHYQPGDVADLRAKIDRIRTDTELRALLSRPLTHLPTFAESIRRYDDAFAAAIMPRVVYHVAGMGPWWKAIVAEQLGQLRDAGLTRVVCTHVGEGEDWLQEKAEAVGVDLRVVYHSDDVQQWECPAIRLVERMAAENDEPILYLHAKGVSHDPATETVFHEWRRLMMRELVAPWRVNVAKLRDADAVGVNWWTKPTAEKNHFSGNCWLVRPSWIRKLPPFDSYFRDRYSCERWIGATPGCRAVSLWCRDKRLWDVHSHLLGPLAHHPR